MQVLFVNDAVSDISLNIEININGEEGEKCLLIKRSNDASALVSKFDEAMMRIQSRELLSPVEMAECKEKFFSLVNGGAELF